MTFETSWRKKARAAGWSDEKIDAVTERLQQYAGDEPDTERIASYLWDAELLVCAVAEYAAEYDRGKTLNAQMGFCDALCADCPAICQKHDHAIYISDAAFPVPNFFMRREHDDCGNDTCPYDPPCDFHGDGEPEEHDDAEA